VDDVKLGHSELFSMYMESIESIINEFKNKDMEALLEDSKKKENETVEMQERTIAFRQTMRQMPLNLVEANNLQQERTVVPAAPNPPNLLAGNVLHHV
jgi:hypothetical protein